MSGTVTAHIPRKITVWERQGKDGWHHNHIEDGWNPSANSPTPMCRYQTEVWKGITWRKFEATLNDGCVCFVADADSASEGRT